MVVDIDIAKFFGHVNHDILMHRIAQVIRDKTVLRLIGRYPRAGVLTDGVVERRAEGTPQGGPLSPLLANIYLNALDRELDRRGLRFCRYADDCNIYVGSEAAAGPRLVGLLPAGRTAARDFRTGRMDTTAHTGGASGCAGAVTRDGATGRRRALRRLGVRERLLKLAPARRGAWRMAANGLMQTGLSNARLRRYGFVMPSDLAARS